MSEGRDTHATDSPDRIPDDSRQAPVDNHLRGREKNDSRATVKSPPVPSIAHDDSFDLGNGTASDEQDKIGIDTHQHNVAETVILNQNVNQTRANSSANPAVGSHEPGVATEFDLGNPRAGSDSEKQPVHAPDDQTQKTPASLSGAGSSGSPPPYADKGSSGKIKLSDRVMRLKDTPTYTPPTTGIEEFNADDYTNHKILRSQQKGGMGRILVAYDEFLKRNVALKELNPEVLDDETITKRFVGEAEITAQLEHPGIVPIHTLGQMKNGNPYYTMKLVHGNTYQEATKAYHRNPTHEELQNLVRRLVSVCKTMAFVHNRGVIHRDLKPANIMLSEYGETLIIDWGLAKPLTRHDWGETQSMSMSTSARRKGVPASELSMAGAVIGTPAFMSPEQALPDEESIGPRSDIFSLGGILYYLLTGQTAFTGRSAKEVLVNVRAVRFKHPSEVKPGIPSGLEAICLKAMAKDPNDRYQTTTAMSDDLCRWLDNEPVLAIRRNVFQKLLYRINKNKQTLIFVFLLVFLVTLYSFFDGWMLQRNRSGINAESCNQIYHQDVNFVSFSEIPFSDRDGRPLPYENTSKAFRIDLSVEKPEAIVRFLAPSIEMWDLSERSAISLSLMEPTNLGGIETQKKTAVTDFFIRIGSGSSYFEHHTRIDEWSVGEWQNIVIPLSDSNWTPNGTPMMSQIHWVELHIVTKTQASFLLDTFQFKTKELATRH